MDLLKQLAQKKSAAVKAWFEVLMSSYPADTAQFLRSQKDPFANPVGQNTFQSLDALYDHLLQEFDAAKAESLIDPILRIRAIQDFTASQAVRFVFDLKEIIRKAAATDAGDKQTQKMWDVLNQRIDNLGMVAFDVYMQCREKIYDLKANEMRNRTLSAFDRAGLIKESDNDTLS